jgi:uncharacterized protein (TIGR02996 family)
MITEQQLLDAAVESKEGKLIYSDWLEEHDQATSAEAWRAEVFTRVGKMDSFISINPTICGGDACIRNTRIPVWVLVNYRRLGGSEESLVRNYPTLTLRDMQAAADYYSENQEEINRAILENEGNDHE